MKRVAICYSGQPRDIHYTYKNHIKNLFEPLSKLGYEVDIFSHIWFDELSLGQPFWSEYPNRGRWDHSVKEIFNQKLLAKISVYEAPRVFDDYGLVPDRRFPHPLQNVISMFYSIEMANNIKNKYSSEQGIEYDVVFRLRPDLFFLKSLTDIDLTSLDKVNIIFDLNKHMDYAVGDHFAYANTTIMNIYSSVFSNLRLICEAGSAINPECLLGFNLKNNNILSKTHDFNHILFRDVPKQRKIIYSLANLLNVNK